MNSQGDALRSEMNVMGDNIKKDFKVEYGALRLEFDEKLKGLRGAGSGDGFDPSDLERQLAELRA